jgi:glycerol-3-phosphate acyltransferase PlsY
VLPWIAVAVLVILRHRENIKRLREGTEDRF